MWLNSRGVNKDSVGGGRWIFVTKNIPLVLQTSTNLNNLYLQIYLRRFESDNLIHHVLDWMKKQKGKREEWENGWKDEGGWSPTGINNNNNNADKLNFQLFTVEFYLGWLKPEQFKFTKETLIFFVQWTLQNCWLVRRLLELSTPSHEKWQLENSSECPVP